jgi:hypothetical protein
MSNIHRRAALLVTAVDELFGTHTYRHRELGEALLGHVMQEAGQRIVARVPPAHLRATRHRFGSLPGRNQPRDEPMTEIDTSDSTGKNDLSTRPTVPLKTPTGYDMQTAEKCTYLVSVAASMGAEWITAKSPPPGWKWTPGNLCSVTSGLYQPSLINFSPLIWSTFVWKHDRQADTCVEPFGFVAAWDDTAFLVFRGSQTHADFGMDFEYSPVPYTPPTPNPPSGLQTERGFTTVFNGLDWASAPFPSPSQYGSLIITGHSLGSALATLAVPLAITKGWPPHRVWNLPQASPKVGNQDFANYYSKLDVATWPLVNVYDLVPHMPPGDYVAVGDPATFGADYGRESQKHDPCCCYSYALLNPTAPYNQGISTCMNWHSA